MDTAESTPRRPAGPLDRLQSRLNGYRFGLRVLERGRVFSAGDGVVWLEGLPSARLDEIVAFADGSEAVVFHLAPSRIGAILLRETPRLKAGTAAWLPGRTLEIGVGDALLGRVIDPLGRPLDGRTPAVTRRTHPLDTLSPPVTARDFVNRPLYTGNKVVDTIVPIGRGQRQLLIGDNGTGKSTLALDVVINQHDQRVRCVYVLIGQRRSSVVHVIETLRSHGALDYTTVVVAEATATPGLKYLAPFAGCAVAEGWMGDGEETLVVYDDLTTHARAYRELSLLLRRPPGREAYPGDIFHLHARLLERSTRLAPRSGGGSMTALPIIETEQGDIATYIPTNLISITDGQIYLDSHLFSLGILPAIDITRSVSRIGGKAQDPAIHREAGRMKLDYLQFIELESFTRFGARLEPSMQRLIGRGRLLRELFKQPQLAPLPVEAQMAWLIAYNERLLDDLDGEALGDALGRLRSGVAREAADLALSREWWCESVTRWLAPETGERDEPAA